VGFYTIIGLATLLGVGIDWSPLNPIKALFYSAVINGFVAVPIMAAMMLVVARGRAMGKFVARTRLLVLGWLATAVMGAAALAMVIMQ
jgi:Mn2+/Fe2+ NRAMP family transporter